MMIIKLINRKSLFLHIKRQNINYNYKVMIKKNEPKCFLNYGSIEISVTDDRKVCDLSN